ncbi:unnamed protein product [Brachionus calyciflorus]|uniref:Uncharacterized protein n=1 Tax=Brachionus calyciflorus TaxID=104777 RepID=A0A813M3V8_9BILA|nr:unnamed protein product [Brachionus calyciflorus]
MNIEPCYRLDPKFSPSQSVTNFYPRPLSNHKRVTVKGHKINPTSSLDFIRDGTTSELLFVSDNLEIYKQNYNYDTDILRDKKYEHVDKDFDIKEHLASFKQDFSSNSSSFNFKYDNQIFTNKPTTLREVQRSNLKRTQSASSHIDQTKIIYQLSKLHANNRKYDIFIKSNRNNDNDNKHDVEIKINEE